MGNVMQPARDGGITTTHASITVYHLICDDRTQWRVTSNL